MCTICTMRCLGQICVLGTCHLNYLNHLHYEIWLFWFLRCKILGPICQLCICFMLCVILGQVSSSLIITYKPKSPTLKKSSNVIMGVRGINNFSFWIIFGYKKNLQNVYDMDLIHVIHRTPQSKTACIS